MKRWLLERGDRWQLATVLDAPTWHLARWCAILGYLPPRDFAPTPEMEAAGVDVYAPHIRCTEVTAANRVPRGALTLTEWRAAI